MTPVGPGLSACYTPPPVVLTTIPDRPSRSPIPQPALPDEKQEPP
jgi:hypothetical protein